MKRSGRWLRLALALTVLAAARPAAATDFVFGVGVHFGLNVQRGYLPQTQLPLLAELKVDSWRDDVHQSIFGPSIPGQPLGPQLDRVNTALLNKGPQPVLILQGQAIETKPVPRYAPTSPRERDLFANFAARVVAATRDFDPIYEVFNEWNMNWRPRRPVLGPLGMRSENPDYAPENYVELAKVTREAIRQVNPKAKVFVGAIGDDDGWTWTRGAVRAGMASTGDGISAHFYNHCNPPARRTAEDLVGKVESFWKVVREEAGPNPPPLYITEFGWPNDAGPCGIPPALAAANLAQFALWAPTTGWIKGIWAYELRNSGQKPLDREDNFGLFDFENAPKPAACMYKEASALSRSLTGQKFRQTQSGLRWLEGQRADGRTVWAIWTTARDSSGTIRHRDGSPMSGRPLCSPGASAGTVIPLGMVPLVLEADRSPDQIEIGVSAP